MLPSTPQAIVARAIQQGWITPPLAPPRNATTPPPVATGKPLPSYYLGYASRPAPTGILEAVAEHYHVGVQQICSRARRTGTVWARHVAVWLVQELTGCTDDAAGATVRGNRYHAVTARAHVTRLISTEPAIARDIAVLTQRLRETLPSLQSTPVECVPSVPSVP